MSSVPKSGRGLHERSPLTVLADGAEQTGHMALLVLSSFRHLVAPRRPGRGLRRVLDQLYLHAVKSLLVVAVVGAFTGMVLALQTGAELREFGAESQLPAIVTAAMCREMGPFITAIILSATAGAAIAAELGTMKVSEEVDALEVMNVDVTGFLVAPRVLSMSLACVVLTVLVDFVGILGGAMVAQSQDGTSYADFFRGARETLTHAELLGVSKALYSGLVKAWFFGLLTGGLACSAGLRAKGGALGVGRAVRTSVTASVVVTLIVGYLLTWMFWA
ncbi:MAG: hypothetical protein HMLKMBBP_01733 [Planctomycetes bacterium]|nr:hypothetical protein [Planctomycetota bacterium]